MNAYDKEFMKLINATNANAEKNRKAAAAGRAAKQKEITQRDTAERARRTNPKALGPGGSTAINKAQNEAATPKIKVLHMSDTSTSLPTVSHDAVADVLKSRTKQAAQPQAKQTNVAGKLSNTPGVNKFEANVIAGTGDLIKTIGGALSSLGDKKMLKLSDNFTNEYGKSQNVDIETKTTKALGSFLQKTGEEVSANWANGTGYDPNQTMIKAIMDPELWTTDIARSLPTTVALIPAMYAGYGAAMAAGTAMGLGSFGAGILGSIGGSALSRPMESWLESGSAYLDEMDRSGDEAKAKKAASSVFLDNLKMGGMDALELATAFAPAPIKEAAVLGGKLGKAAKVLEVISGSKAANMVKKAAIKAPTATKLVGEVSRLGLTAVQEGLEEGVQEAFQRQASGADGRNAFKQISEADAEMKKSMLIGGVFGGTMGAAGTASRVWNKVQARTLERMTVDSQAHFDKYVQDMVKAGVPQAEAILSGLDKLADTEEGKAIIEEVAPQVMQELGAEMAAQQTPVQEAQLGSQMPVEGAVNQPQTLTPQQQDTALAPGPVASGELQQVQAGEPAVLPQEEELPTGVENATITQGTQIANQGAAGLQGEPLIPAGEVEPVTGQAGAPKPETGKPFNTTVYQGRGKTGNEIYNVVKKPIAGEGQYYAFNQNDAKNYGDNVSQHDIKLDNPLVLNNDAQWRELTNKAGWEYPLLDGLAEEDMIQNIDKLKSVIVDSGHDGLVVNMDTSGDASSNLRQLFGHDQVVSYKDEPVSEEQKQLSDSEPYPIGTEFYDVSGNKVSVVEVDPRDNLHTVKSVDGDTIWKYHKDAIDRLMEKQDIYSDKDAIKKQKDDYEAELARATKREEEARRKKKEEEDIGDFYKDKPKIQHGQAKKVLTKKFTYTNHKTGERKVMNRKQFIQKAVNEGKEVVAKEVTSSTGQPKTEYRLLDDDNTFENITKIEFEYYNYYKNEIVKTEPQEKPELKNTADIVYGNLSEVTTERGTKVSTRFAIVDGDDLISSHDTNLRVNEDYPQELQPRDRTRKSSDEQINKIIAHIKPEFLGESPKASDGAPIVGKDMVVESGNGRVIALLRGYEHNRKGITTYNEWLNDNAETFGLSQEDIDSVERPILVRVRQSQIDRVQFTREANEQTVASMDATGQAKVDAEKLTGHLLDIFSPTEDGEIINPSNQQFISEFMGKAVGAADRGKYIAKNGSISQDGVRRIKNAVFAKAYGDSQAIEKLAESTDNNVKNITNAMLIAAPKLAQVKDLINNGKLYPLDITSDIADAMNMLSHLREIGQEVELYLMQINAFGDELSPIGKDILHVFDHYKRSTKKITAILNQYADAVELIGSPDQVSMFDLEVPTKADVLQAAINSMEGVGVGSQAEIFQSEPKNGQKTGAAAEGKEKEVTVPQLPRELAGAKPRYNYRDKAFTLEFENDVDKALYIVAQVNKSKHDAEYMNWLKSINDMSDREIQGKGIALKKYIKIIAKDAEGGTAITVPKGWEEPKTKETAGLGTRDDGSGSSGSVGTGLEKQEVTNNKPKKSRYDAAIKDTEADVKGFIGDKAKGTSGNGSTFSFSEKREAPNDRVIVGLALRGAKILEENEGMTDAMFDKAMMKQFGPSIRLFMSGIRGQARGLIEMSDDDFNEYMGMINIKTEEEETQAEPEPEAERTAEIEEIGTVDKDMEKPLTIIKNETPYSSIQSCSGTKRDHAGKEEASGYIGFLKHSNPVTLTDHVKIAADAAGLAYAEDDIFFSPAVVVRVPSAKDGIGLEELIEEANKVANKAIGKPENFDMVGAGLSNDDMGKWINARDAEKVRLIEEEHGGRYDVPDRVIATQWITFAEELKKLAQTEQATAGSTNKESGITVRQNEGQDGVEIIFPGKPSSDVIAKLHNNQFRWAPKKKLWYAKRTPNRLKFAYDLIHEAVPGQETPVTITAKPTSKVAAAVIVSDKIFELFDSAEVPEDLRITSKELFDMCNEAFSGTQAQGVYSIKDAYDALEMGVNKYIIKSGLYKVGANVEADMAHFYVKCINENIMDAIPSQGTKRTEEMDEFQQFSTPPTIAYIANWVASIASNDVVLEPSAGTGDLAAFAKAAGAEVIVNELAEYRASILKEMGFDRVFTENAEQLNNILPNDVKPTVVVMNPPFSSTAGRKQGSRDTKNATSHIDQALKRLEPGGRLVAIVGRGMAMDAPTFKSWWKSTKEQYTVRANIGIDGSNYKKYGTQFDIQLFVIDKIGGNPDYETITGNERISDLNEVIDLLEEVKNERSPIEGGHGQTEQTSGKPEVQEPSTQSQSQSGHQSPVPVSTNAVGNREQEGSGSEGEGERSSSASGESQNTNASSEPADGLGSASETGTRPGDTVGNSPGNREDENTGGGIGVSGSQTDVGTGGLGEQQQSGITIEATEQKFTREEELTDDIYEKYQPQKLKIDGAKEHPGTLAESAAMSAVEPPAPAYTPNLPKEIIENGVLSLPQLETVVYAGQAHSEMLPDGKRKSFFCGDGTGVGKGRQLAGILLDNFRQGQKKAVWVSKNKSLLKDAARDIADLGMDKKSIKSQGKASAKEAIKHPEGIIFTTYNTLASGMAVSSDGELVETQNGGSRLKQLVNWLGKDFDGVIIFDEAHEMQNAVAGSGGWGKKRVAGKALAGIELQRQLPNAKIVYASATGATEVRNLAYAERLGLWGEGTPFNNARDFISKISAGGIAAMELVARDMKAMGLYLSRGLSYKGVGYSTMEHKLTRDQRKMYDTLAEGWQVVLQNIDHALEETNQGQDGRQRASAMSSFWGTQQRFFNQVLTSMQMPSVIDDIHKQLDKGNACVLQIVNTNQASQDREIARCQAEEEDLEMMDLTPREALMGYIDRAFPIEQWEEYVDEEGNTKVRPVIDSQGHAVINQEMVRRKEDLMERVGAVRVPLGPLEMLLNEFGTGKVAEITGRNRRVVQVEEDGITKTVIQPFPESAKDADVQAFLDGKKDILIFSDAGGTGKSYHASLAEKNQKHRIHYLVQAGWKADSAVQGFGRTHRTNEASAPDYVLVTTDLKGQKRFISSIARRLDQLGALTKGQRQTGSQGLFSAKDNLESDLAMDALSIFYRSLVANEIEGLDSEILNTMGLESKLLDDDGSIKEDAALRDVGKFLNRILILQADLQNQVFDGFFNIVEQMTEQAIENGTLDVGLENFRADSVKAAETKDVYEHESSGAKTTYYGLDVSNKTRARKFEYVKNLEGLKGFYKNTRSGKVYAVRNWSDITLSDGSVAGRYKLLGQNAADPGKSVKKDDFERGNWEQIERADAKSVWNAEIDSLPEFDTVRMHLISGILLPIWDRLPSGRARVVRVKTDQGEVLLGRFIDDAQIDITLRKLDASRTEQSVTTSEVLDRILQQNYRVQLANGWLIKRSRVAGEYRIEIVTPSILNYISQLRSEGVFVERINYDTRAFIPTGAEAEEVFNRVTKSRPVVDMVRKEDDNSTFSMSEGKTYISDFQEGAAEILKKSAPRPTEEDGDSGVYSLKYSPEMTSLRQVARGLKAAFRVGVFEAGMTIIDVGGGSYDEGVKFLASKGVTGMVWDTFARTEEHNNVVIEALNSNKGADGASLNNVLNVIPDLDERSDVLKFLYDVLRPGAKAIVTVYDGNGSGIGRRVEKKGKWSWQENRKWKTYENEIRTALPDAEITMQYGSYIITKQAAAEAEAYAEESTYGFDESGTTKTASKKPEEKKKKQYTAKRKNGKIGKKQPGVLYIHVSALDALTEEQQDQVKAAQKRIPKGFGKYEVVKVFTDGSVSFVKSSNWNTADEPFAEDSMKITPGKPPKVTKGRKTNKQIYHKKWEMVKDDYDGFDVEESKARAEQWENSGLDLDKNQIGNYDYWKENLIDKLPEAENFQMAEDNEEERHPLVPARGMTETVTPQAAQEAANLLAKMLNTVLRSGRMGKVKRTVAANFDRKAMTGKIRKKNLGRFRVECHELGHAFSKLKWKFDKSEMRDIHDTYYPGMESKDSRIVEEGKAEFFTLWFLDNDEAIRIAPITSAKLAEFLYANPNIEATFDRVTEIIEADLDRPAYMKVKDTIGKSDDKFELSVGKEYAVGDTNKKLPKGVKSALKWYMRSVYNLADFTIPLKDLYKAAQKNGFSGMDPAMLASISGSAVNIAQQWFTESARYQGGQFVMGGSRTLKEIINEAEGLDGGYALFDDIYHVMRYKERYTEKFTDAPMLETECDECIEYYESKHSEMIELVKEFSNIFSEINLRMLVHSGVTSNDTADRVRAKSHYYLPLYRLGDSIATGVDTARRGAGPGVRKYTGHHGKTMDSVEACMRRLYETALACEINRTMNAVEDALRTKNMGLFGEIVDPIKVGRRIGTRDLARQIKDLTEKLDGVEADAIDGVLRVDGIPKSISLFMPGSIADVFLGERIIVSKRNGKPTYMRVAPDVYKSVLSMKPMQVDALTKALAAISQASRFGALASARYITNAVARDLVSGKIQSETGEGFMVKRMIQGGFAAAGLKPELYDLYVQSGGYGSSIQEILGDTMDAGVKGGDGLIPTKIPGWYKTKKKGGAWIRKVGGMPWEILRVIEEAPRIAEFESILKDRLEELDLTVDDVLKGNIPIELEKQVERAILDASYGSREIAVNFSLHGVYEPLRKYARTVPFMQGSIQGLYRFGRQVKDKPSETLVRGGLYTILPALIAFALCHDKDWYKDLPSESRDRYWYIPMGSGDFPFFLAIAKPYEYSFAGNMLERSLDWGFMNDPDARKPFEDTWGNLQQSFFSVPMSSMMFSTVIELWANKSYYGGAITPQRDEGQATELQFGSNNSKTAIGMARLYAKLLGQNGPNARQIDYFMRGAFGSVGSAAMNIPNIPEDIGKTARGELPWGGVEDMPVFGSLIYGPAEKGSRAVDRFYEDKATANKFTKAKKNGDNLARNLSKRGNDLVRLNPVFNAISSDLSDLRTEVRDVEASDASDARKKEVNLRYEYIEKIACGYVYGSRIPDPPKGAHYTAAHAADELLYYQNLAQEAMQKAADKAAKGE